MNDRELEAYLNRIGYEGELRTDKKCLEKIIDLHLCSNPIENLEDQAIMEDDRELKAWDAIARYMQSFADTDGDGIANVPEYYETTHGRKVVEDSRNIIDLVKQPNKFSAMIAGICLIFIVIIVLVVFLIRRMIRRIKVRKGMRNSK